MTANNCSVAVQLLLVVQGSTVKTSVGNLNLGLQFESCVISSCRQFPSPFTFLPKVLFKGTGSQISESRVLIYATSQLSITQGRVLGVRGDNWSLLGLVTDREKRGAEISLENSAAHGSKAHLDESSVGMENWL
ncbi:hypothetical protein BaRGS_00037108 [Batillaria attramentaria]|uniref:Uncharacterized protein n=1 Tax=Batillaria attramentaria TaxID=370345 RepID=A0ABD0JA01_9CAEN